MRWQKKKKSNLFSNTELVHKHLQNNNYHCLKILLEEQNLMNAIKIDIKGTRENLQLQSLVMQKEQNKNTIERAS